MKLSTAKIRDLITGWLSAPDSRDEISHHWRMDDPDRLVRTWDDSGEVTALQYEARAYGLKNVETLEDLEKGMWNLWRTGSNWKRAEKRQLKDDADDTFREKEHIGEWRQWHPDYKGENFTEKPTFPCDVLGAHDETLVKRYFDDPKLARKCVYRLFEPDNNFCDNYRLEVITTHDDTEVVGWWITVD